MTTVTSKGQVTIPKRVRDALGIKPGSKVEFGMEEPGRAFVRPEGKAPKNDFDKRLKKARAAFNIGGISTDEYMRIIRGEDD